MITRLRFWWREMWSSFWFVPAMMVSGAVGLATLLIAVDTSVDLPVGGNWPLVFGAAAAGSRGLLAAVASSMITVAGVVFSITIVALSLSSSQYTSRVLRNFMSDRLNQAALGVFVGVFAYCLVVLRAIREGEDGAFVPTLAVLVGLLLAFVGIGFLIAFIHHISTAIQASTIVDVLTRETIATVDRLYPEALGQAGDTDEHPAAAKVHEDRHWEVVEAGRSGYIQHVDCDALVGLSQKHNAVVRMDVEVGDFVVEGAALASLSGSNGLNKHARGELASAFVIARQRTSTQDVAFGIQQIVDVALKALSPGINDTTTAVVCVDHLSAILVRLAERKITAPHGTVDGALCVIARGPRFEILVGEAFNQIRQSSSGNVAVLRRLIEALIVIGGRTTDAHRQQVLRQHADLVRDAANRTIASAHDRIAVEAAAVRRSGACDASGTAHATRTENDEGRTE